MSDSAHAVFQRVVERPILFSAPMVRAILDGSKSQTRRVVPDRGRSLRAVTLQNGKGWLTRHDRDPLGLLIPSPYGYRGDRLWVRETFVLTSARPGALDRDYHVALYRADDERPEEHRWKPSIFMPRRFSRLTLELTGVRVERVQEISLEDAAAEGCMAEHYEDAARDRAPDEVYRELWDSLNAKRGYGWDVNPWVWVLSFARVVA